MKIKLQTLLKHKLQRLLPLVAFLSVCIGANSTTLYIYGGGNADTPSSWTSPVTSRDVNLTNGDREFSINDAKFTTAGDHYIALSTAISNFYEDVCSQIFIDGDYYKGDGVSYVQIIKPNKGNGCIFTYMKYGLSSNVASITISFKVDNTMGITCSGNYCTPIKCCNYTVSSGDAAANPTVTTGSAGSITNNSAVLGGTITYTGTTPITASGIKYYTSEANCTSNTSESTVNTSPTVTTTTGFTVSATGLSASTTYYYKAFATNSSGTGYGSCNSFTTSAAVTETAPVVRMSYMPQNEDNNDVTVSGYVASRGCNNGSTGSITGFTIYYSKTSFSTGSESGVYTKSISAPSGITPSESPARNSVYSMVIPAEDLADNGWRNGDPLYVRIKATNDADLTSDISDIQNITYTLCANMINEVYLLPAEGAVVTGSTLSLLPSVDNTEATGVVYTWEINDVASGTGNSKSVTANANVKIKVTASESTCNSSASVTHNYTVCTPAITNLTISGCPAGDVGKGSSVTLTASTETGTPSSWAWYLDGESTGDTDNSYTFTPSAAVDYTAKVVAEGCPDRKLDAVCVISAKSTFTVPSPAMAPTFNACKDHHQFIWSGESGMFNPAPERYDVCVGSEPGGATDAYGEFEMLGSKYMVWKPGNKAAGTYTYCFTAHRTGYISKSTTLTITYQKTASAQGINSITIDGTAYAGEPYPEVMPWTPAALATSIPAGSSEITSIKWTVSPTGPQISPTNNSATTADFKGRAVDEKTLYTITATGLTSTCGEGGSSTTKIYVKPEAAERCD